MTIEEPVEGLAEPHLTPEQVKTLLGFVQQHNPVIIGGQAVNLWAELMYGMDPELDAFGAMTSKDLDFYHNKAAERALAESLEGGLLEIPDGDNHTPNAAVVKGKLGDREVVVDFLAQVKGVEDKSLLENSITFADADNPDNISITLMHPLDCVRSRLSNINTLGRRDDHPVRQAAASILILDCYIEHELSDPDNKDALRRAQRALREIGYIVRDMHVGKPTELEFGSTLEPEWILRKYREDERLHPLFRENQIQHYLDMIKEEQALAEKRRIETLERQARQAVETGEIAIPKFP